MRKTNKLFVSLTTALLGAATLATSASAATMVQTLTYGSDDILIDSAIVGTGSSAYSFDSNTTTPPTFTANPFDPGLGTLESFRVTWSITYRAIQENGDVAAGVGLSAGGTLRLGGTSYGGNATGGGGSAGPGETVTIDATFSHSQTFPVSEAGVTYDPTLLTTVTGSNPFDLRLNHSGNITPSTEADAFSLRILEGVAATLTYTYAPVPEPSTAALLGLALGAVVWRVRRKS